MAPKRPPPKNDFVEPSSKKSKDSLPKDFFDDADKKPEVKGILKNSEVKPKSILKNSSSPVVPKKIPEQEATPANPTESLPEKEKVLSGNDTSSLPSDFFDQGFNKSDNTTDLKETDKRESNGNKKRKLSSTSEQLPEGFFDDPKQDAKARNVEYKDPKDEEWEKFQKIIQEETKVAETIQEEEDEESEMLKDMDELNNMKSCLSRVDRLKQLIDKKNSKDKSKSKKGKTSSHKKDSNQEDKAEEDDSGDSNDSDEMDDIFNWRAKMA